MNPEEKEQPAVAMPLVNFAGTATNEPPKPNPDEESEE